jgi:glutamyl-tRNA reductase
MNILVVGLNHKTADVEVREKLAFDGEKLTEGLQRLRGLPQVNEAVVLSTCNRVEMYLNTGDVEGATEAVKAFLSEFHNIPAPLLENALYFSWESPRSWGSSRTPSTPPSGSGPRGCF